MGRRRRKHAKRINTPVWQDDCPICQAMKAQGMPTEGCTFDEHDPEAFQVMAHVVENPRDLKRMIDFMERAATSTPGAIFGRFDPFEEN